MIHTVGPVYRSRDASAPLLAAAYRSSLTLAREHGLSTLAFPAISCGVFGYPLDEAADIAVRMCREHSGELKELAFVLFGQPTWDAWLAVAEDELSLESL